MSKNQKEQYVCNFHFEGWEKSTVFPTPMCYTENLKIKSIKFKNIELVDSALCFKGGVKTYLVDGEKFRPLEDVIAALNTTAMKQYSFTEGFLVPNKNMNFIMDQLFKEFKEKFPHKDIKVKTIDSHSGSLPKKEFEIISI